MNSEKKYIGVDLLGSVSNCNKREYMWKRRRRKRRRRRRIGKDKK